MRKKPVSRDNLIGDPKKVALDALGTPMPSVVGQEWSNRYEVGAINYSSMYSEGWVFQRTCARGLGVTKL